MKRLKSYLTSVQPDRYITYLIRFFLVAALVYFLIGYIGEGMTKGFRWPTSSDAEILFVTLLTLALTFTFDFLERTQNIRIPHIISTTSVAFIFGGLYLGSVAGFYTTFWWWDDMLHTLSGVILGLIGFLLIYYLNSRFSMNLSPVFVGLFALTFAVFLGVVWEIFEFTVDALAGTNMQRWMIEKDEFLIGRDYQGVGLRDTMSDLIVDMIGGLIAGAYAYYFYSTEKSRAIKVMKETFGKKQKK